MNSDQQTLLSIVQTWNISEKPEYRGFRCANCQQYKNEAWYHWVNSGDFHLPIHLCADLCEPKFQNNQIQIDQSKIKVINHASFGQTYLYSPEAVAKFEQIIASWPEYLKPELKEFFCDDCGKTLDIDPKDQVRKGYHVWWKMPDGKTLAELHFHKSCAQNYDII